MLTLVNEARQLWEIGVRRFYRSFVAFGASESWKQMAGHISVDGIPAPNST